MSVVLKRVQKSKSGSYTYRRKLPQDVHEATGQREFKRALGRTMMDVTRRYPAVDADCEALIAKARGKGPSSRKATVLAPVDAYRAAREAVAKLLADFPDIAGGSDAAHLWADSVLSEYQPVARAGRDGDVAGMQGEEPNPVSVPEMTRLVVNAVRSGCDVERPAPTLEDARLLYVREKIEGGADADRKTSRINRALGHVLKALSVTEARLLVLADVDRNHARDVRDYLARDRGMKPATVRRTLNDIKAVFRYGLMELGGTDASPFDRLQIKGTANAGTVQGGVSAAREREPFPEKLIPKVTQRLGRSARSKELLHIWSMLAGTGCRLSEVAGLPVSDVHLDADTPYIDVAPREHRRLKNGGSARWVPLTGAALDAAKAAVVATDGPLLFPRYGEGRSRDGASAALMKHVRAFTSDKKVTVHSLRHTLEDRLIKAGVAKDVRDMVLGHAKGDMGERYGGQAARLQVAHKAMVAAGL
ncbi:MAG: tyrosine-type recombinase/integrase [Rhizobiaceae bacterium]